MSNVKIIGADVPNMPWQDRPAEAEKHMPLWRYTENPVGQRYPIHLSGKKRGRYPLGFRQREDPV